MTSEVFVWIYLPGYGEPAVCGRLLERNDGSYSYVYGRSYRDRNDAIPLAPDIMRLAQPLSLVAVPAHCRVQFETPARMRGGAMSPSTVTEKSNSVSWIYSCRETVTESELSHSAPQRRNTTRRTHRR